MVHEYQCRALQPAARYRVRLGTRRVLYALPGEQWRIDAFLLLWKTAEKAGWGEGFERLEGSLLGYEDWQNDAFIDWQKQRKQAAVTDKAKSSGV